MKAGLMISALVLAAASAVRSANAQDTTYGQDPVPDSQFWSGTVPQGYGTDLVPAEVETVRDYRVEYGVDGIPNSRIYDSFDRVGPNLSQPERVLTGGSDDDSRGERTNTRRRRQR